MTTVPVSPALIEPSTETVPDAFAEPCTATAGRGSGPGWAKIPGFCGTIVTATGVVTETVPSFRRVRTYALTLVRSRNSNGSCAVIEVGETNLRGARTPSKYTSVLARVVGSGS